jgi:signal transduction histidine kinase/ligand-binding sensor domain-containing protein/DNA-binding response OmpR family regulator
MPPNPRLWTTFNFPIFISTCQTLIIVLSRKLSLLLCVLLCAGVASASDHPVKYIGIEHGLSNNAVTTIYQDKQGFMWFGTYDGLNRYDGYSFQVFRNNVGDTNSLIGNSIYTLAGDSKDNIWIGGQKGACILNYKQKKITRLKYQPARSAVVQWLRDDIHIIHPVKEGLVLVGTNHLGLIVFENGNTTGKQILLPDGITSSYDVTAIETDPATSTIWIFVQQLGLCKYEAATGKLKLVNNNLPEANCMRRSKDGHVWLGSQNGLYEYDPASNIYSVNRVVTKGKVVHIHEDHNGVLWIGSDGGGLLVMEKGGAIARPFITQEGTPAINSNAVYAIYEDKEGRKWIGTLRGGINTIEPNPETFQLVTYKSATHRSPASNFILSFAEDKQHNLWVGTDGAGLRYWDRKTNTFTEYFYDDQPNALSSNFITSLVCDASNQVWIATWAGAISRFDPATKRFKRYACFNPVTKAFENNVWALYKDKQDRLWASATNDGSLYQYNKATDKFELFDNAISNLQCLAQDAQGNLWGGNYSSLVRIDPVSKLRRTYNIGYTIRCIHEDSRRRLWIGTQEDGLLLFDPDTGKYQRFTTNEGLANNTVLRLLEDDKQNLWLSTFNGLCRFNPDKKTFRNFFQSDGLQSNQFSFNAALALSSGEMAFGGIRGFNIFYPDSVREQVSVPKIFLAGLSIDNAPAETAKYLSSRRGYAMPVIKVPFNRAVLSLDFLALDYSGADKISYAYYLENWDKNWNYVNNIRTANYSHLREGEYFFRVKVKTEDGKWSEGKQLLQVIVLPPWYRTWWAYSLYVITIGLGIYLYVMYSRRQERLKYEIKLAHLENEKDKELNEKKLSFFTHISHEFRTPLSLIINPLKDFVQKKDKQSNSGDLDIAYRNARRLLSLVDQLLLFRKADSGADILKITRIDVVHLCNEVYQCFVQQARARNIRYNFNTTEDRFDIHADYEKIEIALFNLLSNAFKFTPDGGTIDFNLYCSEQTISISVRDTGCGIDISDSDRIFKKFQQASTNRSHGTGFGIGLYLVKHFIESHQGNIEVKSKLNEGTMFTITLPAGTRNVTGSETSTDLSNKHELLDELREEETLLAETGISLYTDQGKSVDEVVTEKKIILVVDDDKEIREYMRHIFGDRYILYMAENGTAGLQSAEQHMPDLVISDIHMHEMDGLELCARLKQSERLGHIPVILLTAASSTDTHLKGIEGGADDYITKPFDSKLLQARVETILKNRNILQRYFFDSITLQESAIKVPAEYRDFLRRCISIVEENLDTEDFTIQKFCKAMGMSRSSLYQKVKQISGQSLNAFIRSIRLRRAAVLMIRENMNVNQASFQVGIGDVRYFREQFVKLFGMTPSDYIKKYRQTFSGDLNLIKGNGQ